MVPRVEISTPSSSSNPGRSGPAKPSAIRIMSASMWNSVPSVGMNPPGIRLPSTRFSPVTLPSRPSMDVELTPNTRSPPSSCAAEMRSISGYVGQGVDGSRVGGGITWMSNWVTDAALSQRGAVAVGPGVAAADDHHPLALRAHLVLLDQVRHGQVHPGEIAAVHGQLTWDGGPGADDSRVEVGLQLLHRQVAVEVTADRAV